MFLPANRFMFGVYALVGGAFLILEMWATVTIPLRARPDLQSEAIFLSLAMLFAIVLFGVMYVLWLQKYYYFYTLRGLLKRLTARSREYEFVAPDGVRFLVSGDPSWYTITMTVAGENGSTVFSVQPGWFWGRTEPDGEGPRRASLNWGEARPLLRMLVRRLSLSPSA